MVHESPRRTSVVVIAAAAAIAAACCGGGDDAPPASAADARVSGNPADARPTEPRPDATPHVPGTPGLGAHALAYYRLASNPSPLTTEPMTTQPSGSTMIVSVGRGDIGAFVLPTDNKGNAPYTQLGDTHPYTLWSSSGTALYAFPAMAGGSDHVVRAATPEGDEITLAAVEVVDGGVIQDVAWNEVLAGNPLTSLTVTTTGPATLVAFWWGDAGVDGDKTAVPNNGFAVIDSILLSGALVQCAVATREVAGPGTYDVTWTATPAQGAQLWLVAVQ